MAWSDARCKCGDTMTRYSYGWRHHENYSLTCPDGSDPEPIEEVIEFTRYVTRAEYERLIELTEPAKV